MNKTEYLFSSLFEISQETATDTNLSELGKKILLLVMGNFGVAKGILLIHEDRSSYKLIFHKGYRRIINENCTKVSLEEQFVDNFVNNNNNFIDLTEKAGSVAIGEIGTIRELGIKAVLPIQSKSNDNLGFVFLGKKMNEDYSEKDIQTLKIISTQISSAIELKNSMTEIKEFNLQMKKKLVEISSLQQATNTLNQFIKKDELYREILFVTIGLLGAKGGVFFSPDQIIKNRFIKIKISRNLRRGFQEINNIDVTESFELCLKKGEPFFIEDKINEIDDFLEKYPIFKNHKNDIILPFVIDDDAKGFALLNKKLDGSDFNQNDKRLLSTYKNQVTTHMKNSELFEEISIAHEEEKRIRNLFQRYVPKEVVSEVVDQKKTEFFRGELKEVVIFFSDIRKFTSISETLPPAKVVDFLNKYLALMVDIIIDNGGMLDKFIGDAIMAAWGLFGDKSDIEFKAVKSCIEMKKALNEFNNSSGLDINLKIGMGLNKGEVLAGNIGCDKRMDYTMIGDNVNLASRLESITKFYGVELIISESVYNTVKDRIIAREIDTIRVVGKSKDIRIFEVYDLKT